MLDVRFEPMGQRYDGKAQERMIVEGLDEPISREIINVYFLDGKPKVKNDPRRVIYYTGPRWEEVLRKMGLCEHVHEMEVDEASIVIVWTRKPGISMRTFYRSHFRYVAELADRELVLDQPVMVRREPPKHIRFRGMEVTNLEGMPLRISYFPGGVDHHGRRRLPSLSLA